LGLGRRFVEEPTPILRRWGSSNGFSGRKRALNRRKQMASLQDPPEHSRILQTFEKPSQPWTKIIIGFTLGVVCTFLLAAFLFMPGKGSQSQSQSQSQSRVAKWAESKNAEAEKAKAEAQRTETAPADDSASRDAAAVNDPCDKQTWPYVSHECAAAQRTRNVRVITTDKSAPQTVTTAAPVVPPRTTEGRAPEAQAPRPDATSQTTAVTTPNAAAPAPAAAPAAPPAPAPVTTAAAPAQPTPPPAPPAPEPQAKPQPAVDNQASTAPQPETQPGKKSRDRREARQKRDRRDQEARRENRDSRDSRESRETTGFADPRVEEVRSGDEPRRTSRSRDDSRTNRSRVVDSDDDNAPARSSRSRDERRRIVIERPAEETVVREERPRQRALFPFFFLNGADND
jgi:hypothetical protein